MLDIKLKKVLKNNIKYYFNNSKAALCHWYNIYVADKKLINSQNNYSNWAFGCCSQQDEKVSDSA